MKKPYQRKPLPGHRPGMEVRDSAVEAMETAEAARAAETTATANPAKTGEAQPPNPPPDDNAPVTRGEFREETYKLDRKIDATKAELKEDISATKAELKEDISNARAELNKNISDTKIELKDDIHTLERRLLWAVLSATGGLAVLVLGAILGAILS